MIKKKVVQTNDESTYCKSILVRKGYIDDPYIQFFFDMNKPIFQNSPEMNRGYYVRYTFMHDIVKEGIKVFQNNNKNSRIQIVSLGCGFDTFFFKLGENKDLLKRMKYVEVDFPEVINKKIKSISRSSKVFSEYIKNQKILEDSKHPGGKNLVSDHYCAFSCDMSDSEYFEKQVSSVLNKKEPIIVISEMVLAYLKASDSSKLIDYFSKNFENCLFSLYEAINPHDQFGKTMVQKIRARGCPLQSIEDYPTLESQKKRFLTRGYNYSNAKTLLEVTNSFFGEKKLQEIAKKTKDFFDEYFLFNMLMSHYTFVVSLKTKIDVKKENELFKKWLK